MSTPSLVVCLNAVEGKESLSGAGKGTENKYFLENDPFSSALR